MAAVDVAALEGLPLDELRARRTRARRAAELARLRSRQSASVDEAAAQQATDWEAEAGALTDALIARYAADLSLVDSLLEEPYPAQGTRRG